MTDAGYFRGTSAEQDARFADKRKKQLKEMKSPEILGTKLDMRKVKLDDLKPWIEDRIKNVLKSEDELLPSVVYNYLTSERYPDGKQAQLHMLNLYPDNDDKLYKFMDEFWTKLIKMQEATIAAESNQVASTDTVNNNDDSEPNTQRSGDAKHDTADGGDTTSTHPSKSVSKDTSDEKKNGEISHREHRRRSSRSLRRDGSPHSRSKSRSVSQPKSDSGSRSRSGSRARSIKSGLHHSKRSETSRSPRSGASRSRSRSPRSGRSSHSTRSRASQPKGSNSKSRSRSRSRSRSPRRLHRRSYGNGSNDRRFRVAAGRYQGGRNNGNGYGRRRYSPQRRPYAPHSLNSANRNRRQPSPFVRRRRTPSLSPRRRRTPSMSPRRRHTPSLSPRRRRTPSLSPRRRHTPSLSPRRRVPARRSPAGDVMSPSRRRISPPRRRMSRSISRSRSPLPRYGVAGGSARTPVDLGPSYLAGGLLPVGNSTAQPSRSGPMLSASRTSGASSLMPVSSARDHLSIETNSSPGFQQSSLLPYSHHQQHSLQTSGVSQPSINPATSSTGPMLHAPSTPPPRSSKDKKHKKHKKHKSKKSRDRDRSSDSEYESSKHKDRKKHKKHKSKKHKSKKHKK